MSASELRQKFLEFFKSKGHVIVASSSLIPDDPTVLLTTAGMQQFKKYYTGEADPVRDFGSENTTSVQKSFRTSDINEVGDDSHLTFFEMLGNFSFGGYFKKEAIEYAHEFICKVLKLNISYVTIFKGSDAVPADDESEKYWKELDPNIVVKRFGRKDNFWGPTGAEGPCGPTTEIYVNGLEVWNIVFNQYYQYADKKLESLKTPGIDTGMGLERLVMVSQGVSTIFDTDLLRPIMELIPSMEERKKRIVTDHARAVAFMLSDGFRPSNKEAGYVLRRIMRRLIVYAFQFKIEKQIISNLFRMVQEIYDGYYPELDINLIISEFSTEKDKFDNP